MADVRLIDANALIRKICFRCKDGDGEGMCAESCRFIAAIDNTPAIDAAPVVHGRWKSVISDSIHPNEGECSVCKRYYRIARCFDYCPHCGAKMDGKE